MKNPIWKAFDLANSGRLRGILKENYVEEQVIQAVIDILAREENRLIALIESKKQRGRGR